MLSDSRYGLRQLRKHPGFSAVAILMLVLGIGATTALREICSWHARNGLHQVDASKTVRQKGYNMEPSYLLIWLAGGGLVTLKAYARFCLLKSAQRIEDAEEEKL